ncbi:hypothetical protein PHJA_000909000 [Phtheirospermum japonicum]|uniref:Uncharacterized protein n=1 Tax=Phtheirospermum japonicum TaxID=374723 RepID=A0A830BUL9_9LAMI|nr:hypothetical protein PHJA_000909000 [Phtheirospermum japonicum]
MAESTEKVIRGSSWHWTNERHVRFLNSMEASFLQSHFPPLDRYLPDTSDSTKDLGKETKYRTSCVFDAYIILYYIVLD